MKKTIIVIGDVMLDRYVEGSVTRISPEAPVPVVNVQSESYKLGGAANVAHNLNKLGTKTVLIGATANDDFGKKIAVLLKKEGIVNRLIDSHTQTTVKTRILSKSHQMIRIDREEAYTPDQAMITKIKSSIKECSPSCILISDYNKGVVSEETMGAILEVSKAHDIKVIIDPKHNNWTKYQGAYLIKPNLKELKEASTLETGTVEDHLKAIFDTHSIDNLLVTRSAEGMTLINQDGITHFPVKEAEVYDVTGAGDTAIAVIGYGITKGMPLDESITLANAASAYVVTKNKTYAISLQELEELDKA